MIRYAVGLIVRAFVELGLVLFVIAVLFFVVAYRLGRLFATPEPDRLDRLAAQLGRALGLAATARAAAGELDEEGELPADPAVEQADYLGDVDWREVVV